MLLLYFRVIVKLFPIVALSPAFSQITLFSDLYIAPKNELHIVSGNLYFEKGKIITDRGSNAGVLSFSKGSSWENANHNSHVDGNIRFYEGAEFLFPVGQENVYQPLQLFDFSGSDYFDLTYHHHGHELTHSQDTIAAVSNSHFWALRNPKGRGRVILSWNPFSGVNELLSTAPLAEKALDLVTIGAFDGERWIAIESEFPENSFYGAFSNSILEGVIQSKNKVDFSKYSAFTLMMRNIPPITSNNISQAITPNGDGKNDTWIIKRIEQYPKAIVAVYSRWGELVFSAAAGYNNDWTGAHKNKSTPLPTGPYFYIIDHDGNGTIDFQGWLYISD